MRAVCCSGFVGGGFGRCRIFEHVLLNGPAAVLFFVEVFKWIQFFACFVLLDVLR